MNAPLSIVGGDCDRVDGREKVTGRARYAADNDFEHLAHAVGVFSTIGSGAITRLETFAARRAPGVMAVLHHGNIPKLHRFTNDWGKAVKSGERRPLFEDETIYYAGQFIALVVAKTFEQARTAARLVRVSYRENPLAVSLDEGLRANGEKTDEESPDSERGDVATAWARATVKIDVTYQTPVEVHNPMELHATVARWKGNELEVHDSTQWVVGQRNTLAKFLKMPAKKITVHAPHIGGGFGGKLFLWPHTVAAVVAARVVGCPVKLVLERKNEFTTVGHRPATRQRIRLGAEADGRLLTVQHDTHAHTSRVDEFIEEAGETTRSLYHCPNVKVTHRMVPVNAGTPTAMRAPGAAPGLFALESAMDELAVALKLDPVELRLRNHAKADGDKKLPWSSNHLKECIQTATERFGWKRRKPTPGSMRDGSEIIGWGFGAASWPAIRQKCSARVELGGDGGVVVSCATQDIGTGTYTIIAQVVADVLGLPMERVKVALGNSNFPEGPISGGSMVTSTVVPTVAQAARAAVDRLRELATARGGPLAGIAQWSLQFRGGALVAGARRATVADILQVAKLPNAAGTADAKPGPEAKKYAFRCFGVHCVEVRWDPAIARLRVSRVTSAFDAGRVINRKTAANQIYGAIVMGVGMTLFEESVYDRRTGRVVTDNLADYLLPVNADTPEMDITFLRYPDPHIGEFGARGLGEIGITGLTGAIANAVYHATGRRIRDLPISLEKIIG